MGGLLLRIIAVGALGFPSLGKSALPMFQSLETSPPQTAPSVIAWQKDFVPVPAGTYRLGSREGETDAAPREVTLKSFRLARHEVTVAEYAAYLNDQPPGRRPVSPDLEIEDGRWVPRRGMARRPAAWVTPAEAAAYAVWLSAKTGVRVRLPTEDEWEAAARGGVVGARYPWGWGAPEGRACFSAASARVVGSYDPNPLGLYDMAGNVFEWCADTNGAAAPVNARGGSWAERDPKFLRVFHRTPFRRDYRGADVGFRVLVEAGD